MDAERRNVLRKEAMQHEQNDWTYGIEPAELLWLLDAADGRDALRTAVREMAATSEAFETNVNAAVMVAHLHGRDLTPEDVMPFIVARSRAFALAQEGDDER